MARHYDGSSLDRMRTRDKVCSYMNNFIFFMYSWFLAIVRTCVSGANAGANAARDMLARNLKRGGCMLIDVGQFD